MRRTRPTPPPAEGPLERLSSKYKDLEERHRRLVERYAAEVHERGSAVTLAFSALRASRSAMALARGGGLLVRNQAWLALGRVHEAGWRSADRGRTHRSLDALGLDEAAEMLRAREVVRETRYEREDPEQVLAVRCERLKRPGLPVVLLIVRDVTERVRGERELARARELMAEQERVRAIGQLASGVAHDLNNVLHAMALRLEALRKRGEGDPRERAGVAALARLVEDAASRVSRLQDLAARRQDAPSCDLDLAAALREAVDTARPDLEHGGGRVTVESALPPLPRVVGSGDEVRHVLLNLLLNARDAMPDGGAIHVSAERRGARVVARVEDEGRGFLPEALPRVFDPFFTTKGDKGTGLGLAIARSVMLRLGGGIRARNAGGHGAVVELEFPVARSAERREEPAPRAEPRAGSRVLVVDDDPDVLEAARLVLEDLGEDVETAGSGDEALGRVEAGARFDVVLCDVGMPGMSGWEVADRLEALAPGTPVYLVTGWAHEIAPDDPRRRAVRGVLPKPLPIEALRAIFASPGGGAAGDPQAPARRPAEPPTEAGSGAPAPP